MRLRGLDTWDLLFGAAWLMCTGLLIAPLWVGSMTPLRDFGSHVIMAEVWTRYDEVPAYSTVFGLRSGFNPNLLAVRFADLVSPLLGPLAAVRLFVSLALLGTSVTLVWALREFERSRWQVFLGLPFLWGGMLGLGLVNYVAAFPLMLAGLALGRRAGLHGGRNVALALAAVGLAAYLVHGLAFVFVAAFAGMALLVSLRRLRHLLHAAAMLPAAGLWAWWMVKLLRREQLGNPVDADDSGFATADLQPMENLHWFLRQSLDLTLEHVDTAVFCILGAAWVVLLATAAGRPVAPPLPMADPQVPWWQRLGGMAARLWQEVQQQAVLIIVLLLGAGVYFLPAYVNEVAVNSRLFTPFSFAVAMLPRADFRGSRLASAAVACAIAANVWLGVHLIRSMAEFDARELAPIEALLEDVPEGSSVECLGVRTVESVFFRRPLEQTCHALVQLHTHGYTSSAFAGTGHNALRFLSGPRLAPLGTVSWQNNIRTLGWDYLIVRGRHLAPRGDVVELVAVTEPDETREPWSLYRVVGPKPPAEAETLLAGGSGGTPGQTWCGDGEAVDTLSLRVHSAARGLSAAHVDCRALEAGQGGQLRLTGALSPGLVFGEGPTTGRLSCPEGQAIVGLFGMADSLIQSVGLVCTPWSKVGLETAGEVRQTSHTATLGREQGEAYELLCPPAMVMRGLAGRGGALVDGLGPICAPPQVSSPPKTELSSPLQTP